MEIQWHAALNNLILAMPTSINVLLEAIRTSEVRRDRASAFANIISINGFHDEAERLFRALSGNQPDKTRTDASLRRRKQILVIGSGKDQCSDSTYQSAYKVGSEIAKRNGILLTGGLGGVMEAASKGAREAGGLVVGIIPQDNKAEANSYCDVVIATGFGSARDFVTAYSADAVIIVGGGAGTLIEAAAAYQKRIPIIALRGSGGVADRLADNYLDDRAIERIIGESNPETTVNTAFKALT